MAEYTAVLNEINNALNDRGASKSASQLIGEVRDIISDGPTLRASILSLEATIKDEFKNLRNIMTGGFGTPAGGVAGAGKDTPGQIAQSRQTAASSSESNKHLTRIETFMEGLAEVIGHGRGGEAGVAGGVGGAFGATTLHQRIEGVLRAVKENNQSTSAMLRDTFKSFYGSGGTVGQQYEFHAKRAAFDLVNLATKTHDLISIFGSLENFIKRNIIERYSGYQANRAGGLSGMEYFTDDFKRILDYMKGIRPEVGHSLVATQEGVKSSLQEGMASPMLTFGRNIDQLSTMYRSMITEMERRGQDPRSFGSPQQLQRLIDVLGERDKALGPFGQMRTDRAITVQENSIEYLKAIAKYTNVSADEIIKLVKANTQTASELQVMGLLTEQQGKAFVDFQSAMQTLGGNNKVLSDMVTQWIGAQRNPALFAANNPRMGNLNAMMGGELANFLERVANITTAPGKYEEKQPALTRMANEFAAAMQQRIQSMANPGHWWKEYPELAQITSAAKVMGANPPQLATPPEKGWIEGITQKLEDVFNQVPMFKGAIGSFGGLIGEFGKQIAIFYAASRVFRGAGAATTVAETVAGGTAGATVLRSLSSVANVIAKVMPVVSAAGGAASAYAGGASTEGVIGAAAGGGGGAIVGSAIGSLAGPMGRVIGASIGGYLGTLLGQNIGERGVLSPAAAKTSEAAPQAAPQYTPAVPPPSPNMVGPEQAAVMAQTNQDMTRTLHAEQIQYLSSLVTVGMEGNSILGQMVAELRGQTAASTGQAATSSTPLPAHGLASNAPSLSSPYRAQAAYPYASVDV